MNFKRYAPVVLLSILFFAFFTRIWRLYVPQRYVFDEVYHAVTAKLIARNDQRAYEWWNPPPEPDTAVDWLHPPLAKYTQAFFIKTFGENSFAWRLSSVFFGVGVIYLVYRLSFELFQDEETALLAAFLAALDGLLLTQSRIAMNDIHVTFFILLTLIRFIKLKQYQARHALKKTDKKLWLNLGLVGVAGGLALASKWSGLFVLVVVWLWEAGANKSWLWQLHQKAQGKATQLTHWLSVIYMTLVQRWWYFIGLFICWLLIPALLYLAAYAHMFLQGKNLQHFIDLHKQIWWYQTTLDATHPYQSRPWQWFFDLRPVWYHVDYVNENYTANIYAFGNPILFWLGDIALVATAIALLYMITTALVKKRQIILADKKDWTIPIQTSVANTLKPITTTIHKAFLPLSFTLLAYSLVWMPWVLSPRIMFFYHYTPAVPLLCIILAFWLRQLIRYTPHKQKLGANIIIGLVGTIVLTFFIWYPHWTAIPMPKQFINSVYFFIPSWH